MVFDILFEQRILVAEKLKACIRDLGFTKVSFCKRVGISRPTLDRLMNGVIDNKSTFDKHLRKILDALGMTADELLFYSTNLGNQKIKAVYSSNAPDGYQTSQQAEKQYNLLMDVLDLCMIYY